MATPKSDSFPSMDEALVKFSGPRKNEALEFLRSNLHTLKTEGQFMKAYAGLSACQQLLGPLSGEYRKALEEMRKTLDSMVKSRNLITPDDWIVLVQNTAEGWINLFEKHVPAEIWNKVKDESRALFKNLRG